MKKLLLTLPLVILLTGCNIFNRSSSSSNSNSGDNSSDTSSGSGSSSSSSSSSSSGGQEAVTSWINFEEAEYNDGTQFNESKAAEFVTFLNGYGNIFSSIGYSNVRFASLNETTGTTPSTLQVGTGSYPGEMSFNFTHNVTKVEFNMQRFYKWNDYAGAWNLDADSKMIVNDESHTYTLGDGNTQAAEIPQIQSASISFATPVKTLRFYNDALKQRFFIRGLKITYLKN